MGNWNKAWGTSIRSGFVRNLGGFQQAALFEAWADDVDIGSAKSLAEDEWPTLPPDELRERALSDLAELIDEGLIAVDTDREWTVQYVAEAAGGTTEDLVGALRTEWHLYNELDDFDHYRAVIFVATPAGSAAVKFPFLWAAYMELRDVIRLMSPPGGEAALAATPEQVDTIRHAFDLVRELYNRETGPDAFPWGLPYRQARASSGAERGGPAVSKAPGNRARSVWGDR